MACTLFLLIFYRGVSTSVGICEMHLKKSLRQRNSLLLFFIIFSVASGYTQESRDGVTQQRNYAINDSVSIAKTNAVAEYILLYQRYVSGMRGGSCTMYPSCSNYGLIQFSNRSFWPAMVGTAERMTRCGHDLDFYPKTIQFGEVCALDFPFGMKENRTLAFDEQYNVGSVIKPENSIEKYISVLIDAKLYEAALSKAIYFTDINKNYVSPNIYAAKLLCYEYLNRQEDGIIAFKHFPDAMKSNNAVLRKYSRLYSSLGNINKAIDISITIDDNDYKYRDINYLGYLYARNHDYNSALKCFEDAAKINPEYLSISEYNISATKEMLMTKWKKPALAAALSIVPGLGYVYTKNYKTAITAFIINGLLAYTVYQSFDNHQWGLGAIFCSLNLAFYVGNFTGASKSANRYNDFIHNNYINKLRQRNIIDNY